MNVPVLVLKGFNFNSRCGESIIKNSGLDYFIAKDKNGYGVDACWISWLKKKRPNEYLSIYPCK